MAQTDTLLRYRPWRGTPRGPLYASAAMARASLKLLFRRRLMWGLFALGLLVFFFFFYAQYLVVWITQPARHRDGAVRGHPGDRGNLTRFLDRLALNGTAHTFGNFIWFQGYVAGDRPRARRVGAGGQRLLPRQPAVLPVEADRPLALRAGQVPRRRRAHQPAHHPPGRPALAGSRAAVRLGNVLPRQLRPAAGYPRLRADAHGHAQPAGGRDRRVGAADGAAGDGLDGAVRAAAACSPAGWWTRRRTSAGG